ncbi:DUF1189 family protein [Vagococcus xieshaowenii]|uniref:DUF1189 domain-containing protein n=1 Tax=Vagococcus xieshaowenii TaxID=2562451 RepID=A0AAJ5EH91_9ENTE|nr:DUF1189 family protein [Vagococcus xieshaowenii]QCA28369.1 DUF1189 domain-containing protein [Vagococcus xieshaowenii]TFZ42874.1 DUF1189 domain-containing protein [Vagococcus xieshaowenii]
MNILSLFKEALRHPQNLFMANRLSKKIMIPYFLLLSLILGLPLMGQAFIETKQVEKNIQEIVKQTPEFSFKDNQLVTKEPSESFIYTSDYFLFAFDPENKLSADDIKTRLVGNQIGLGYLKNHLVVTMNDSNPFIGLLGKNTLKLDYKDIDQTYFSQTIFKSSSLRTSEKAMLIGAIILMTLVPMMIMFGIYLLLGTLIGHTFERARMLGLTLGNSFKLFIAASTLPVVASTILSIFFPSLDILTLIIVVSVIIYSNNIRQIKKQLINSQNKKN